MLLAVATPMHMIMPGERRNVERGVRDQQHPEDAGQRAGQRRDDDEGIEPGLEIDDDQQIDQDDGDGHARAQAGERGVHGGHLPAALHLRAARQLVLEIRAGLSECR